MDCVRTNSPKSQLCKYLIHTFWLPRNCWIVSRHIPPSQNCVNTQFTHFDWLEIVGLCPDTFLRVRTVQIPNPHIFTGYKVWDCVRTHYSESELCKYLIHTFWLPTNCWIVLGHIPPSWNCANTQFTHFDWLEIVGMCLDIFLRV